LCANITLYLYGYRVLYCIVLYLCTYIVFVWVHCVCVGILHCVGIVLCGYIVFVWVDCICVGILFLGRYIVFYVYIVFVYVLCNV
jgi:hypothetical protein